MRHKLSSLLLLLFFFIWTTNVTPITRAQNILTSHHPKSKPIKTPSNPAKNSFNFMGEFPSKEHWQDCYETLLDNLLQINWCHNWRHHFVWVCWSHFTSSERESAFLGPLLKKNKKALRAHLAKTRAWWHQVHKSGLHTLQMSAWDVWNVATSVKTQT